MKNRIKNILCFIIGGLIFGCVGVYAATAVISKNISYDNTKSKMESDNVQDAIDEMYSKIGESRKVYLIKSGVIQDGYSFNPMAIRPSYWGGGIVAPSVSMQDGFIRLVESSQGSYVSSDAIDMTPYDSINVKYKATVIDRSTNCSKNLALPVSLASGYDSRNFINAAEVNSTDFLYLTLPLKNVNKSSHICFTVEFGTTDLYDMWFEVNDNSYN